ncbi:MAG TPA: class I SAM-dependent methyltransferase [Thiobacillaceae bacterium]|nr:class I SAM-dependent methyltransferase [Thiobacillaceae bacterium]HNU64494.1 class I SAM-dependent methyltransferase [Thiobacillaceae bacterium]
MTDQRHRYDYQIRPGSGPEKVIHMVGAGHRVLELGPGPGSITRHLHANGCRVTALELDEEAIDLVAPFCEQVRRCDLNDPEWPALMAGVDKFPVVVAADVLEHLYDPWSCLKRMLPLLAAEGCLVVSLPHIAHSAIIACLLNEDFAYQSWGLLDRTHVRFWGLKNMQKLFENAGFKIIEAEFVVLGPEQTEFAHFWHKLPKSSREMLSRSRFGCVYQVVIRAVPRSADGKALQLMDLNVSRPAIYPYGDHSASRRLLRELGARLDPATQARIVRLLRRFRLWPRSGSSR